MGLGLAWTAPVEVFALRLTYTRYAPLCVFSEFSQRSHIQIVIRFFFSGQFQFSQDSFSIQNQFNPKFQSSVYNPKIGHSHSAVFRLSNFAPRLRICNPLSTVVNTGASRWSVVRSIVSRWRKLLARVPSNKRMESQAHSRSGRLLSPFLLCAFSSQ